ncbi:MAG: hypothetical protein EOO08_09815 [Chitinophagaceae bacterium]|nr:MAG: hypothetical protein EOO08_09815 [Chitinophagaceae bacterium]
MEHVKVQFQTPQDFQQFRKMTPDAIVSMSIADLFVICNCELLDIAHAINQFGAVVTDMPADHS